MHYWTPEGRQILDGVAGLWCVNAGHGRREITQAVASQLETMDYAPPFQMAHPGAFALANELVKIAPERLDHVFFTNSGSESVDTALKSPSPGTARAVRPHARVSSGASAATTAWASAASRWAASRRTAGPGRGRCCRGSTTCRTLMIRRGTLSRAAHRRTERSWQTSSERLGGAA